MLGVVSWAMKYLNIRQYANLFGISRPTVYRRIEEGKLHTMEIEGNRKLILVEDTEYERVKGN